MQTNILCFGLVMVSTVTGTFIKFAYSVLLKLLTFNRQVLPKELQYIEVDSNCEGWQAKAIDTSH